jgi:hypothetical protein
MWLPIVMLLLLAMPGFAHAVDVTACGTVVPERNVGVLQADLDCGALPVGVTLLRGARLQLNGHVLSGGVRAVLADITKGRAWIDGPGTVAGAEIGISTPGSTRGRGAGLHLTDVTLNGNGIGVFADRLRLTRVDAQGNNHGISANYRVKGDDVVASNNNRFGVWSAAGTIRMRRLTATDNGWFGVIATQGGRVALVDSTVTGNAAAYGGIDISSSRRPSLRNVTCGLSSDSFSVFVTGTSWGVCASD